MQLGKKDNKNDLGNKEVRLNMVKLDLFGTTFK